MNWTAVVGWLIWNTMRLLAALGLTVLAGMVGLLIWFMFDAGLAWISIVLLAAGLVLVFSFVKRVQIGPLANSDAGREIVE
jgi:hypothetical protein